MARKRGTKRLYLYPNISDLANLVITEYARKVPTKLADMQRNYASGIQGYLGDATKRQLALTKLTMWYSALREYVDRIATIYGEIRGRYKANLRAMIAPAPVPPPAVPAVAPAPAPPR